MSALHFGVEIAKIHSLELARTYLLQIQASLRFVPRSQ